MTESTDPGSPELPGPPIPPGPSAPHGAPPGAPAGGGFPLWAKLLLGCGVLVLVVGVVAAALAFWGLHRLTRPGPTVAAEHVVGPDAVGWVRVESISDDPGMQELVQSVFMALQRVGQRQQREQLPPWMRGWVDLSQAQQGSNPFLHWFLPHETTLSFEPGLDASGARVLDPVGTLNLGLIARFIGWIDRLDDDGEPLEVRGYQVIEGKDHVLALRGGTMWVAQDLASFERLLDRVEGGLEEGMGPPPAADPRLAAVGTGEWDVHLYLDNRRGDFEVALAETFAKLGDEPGEVVGTVDELFLQADVLTADALVAELHLEAVSEEAARRWSDHLEQHRTRVRDQVARYELETRVDGSGLWATWRIEGLDVWLGDLIVTAVEDAELMEQMEPDGSEEPGGPVLPPEAPETLEAPG